VPYYRQAWLRAETATLASDPIRLPLPAQFRCFMEARPFQNFSKHKATKNSHEARTTTRLKMSEFSTKHIFFTTKKIKKKEPKYARKLIA
jgi:hypothetical protein